MGKGADPEQLDRMAERFRGEAVRIDNSLSELHRLSKEAVWRGADAQEFYILIQGELRTRLNHGASRLKEAAIQLQRQAEQQRQASAAEGHGATGNANGRRTGPGGRIDLGPFASFMRDRPWPLNSLGPVIGLALATELAVSLALILPGGVAVAGPTVGVAALAYAAALVWPHGPSKVTPWPDSPPNLKMADGASYHRRADGFGNYLDEMRDLRNGEIEIRQIEGSHPPRAVVILKGIDGFLVPDSPGSVTDTNAAIIERLKRSGRWSEAVKSALDQANLPKGTQVMLIGHSGGGIVAANLAGDAQFVEKYGVTHVLTNGSGVTDKLAGASTGVKVLMMDNRSDVVARTIQAPFPPGRGDGVDRIAYSFDDRTPRGGSADLGSGHHYDHYSNALDTTDDPAVKKWLKSAGGYLGTGKPNFFRMGD